MTKSGAPLENVIAERVNGILKDKLLEEYFPDFKTAQNSVSKAISLYYRKEKGGIMSTKWVFKGINESKVNKKA